MRDRSDCPAQCGLVPRLSRWAGTRLSTVTLVRVLETYEGVWPMPYSSFPLDTRGDGEFGDERGRGQYCSVLQH